MSLDHFLTEVVTVGFSHGRSDDSSHDNTFSLRPAPTEAVAIPEGAWLDKLQTLSGKKK